MAAVDMKNREDLHLEAGLRSTQEEEKVPFISNGDHQDRNSSQHPLDPQQPRTMSPLKRVAMFLMLGLCIGVVLSVTQDASMSCLGWHRDSNVGQANVVRSVLAKRQNTGTNTTTSDALGPAASIDPNQSTSAPTTTTSQQTSDSTTTSSSTTSSQPDTSTSSSETTSTSTTQTPPTSTSTSSSTSSTTSQSSSSSGTSSTRNETVTQTSSSSVAPVSSSSSVSSLISSSDVETTSSNMDLTITAGPVSTSSPVPLTLTTTLPDGGTLTITSVSWVAVVPSDAASGGGKPKLQNAAAKSSGHLALAMVLGALSVGMLVV